ncbi:MAG: hypothetical protein WCG27_03685 [Pseudomonadota bacterium]
MRPKLTLSSLLALFSLTAFAQQADVNTAGNAPDAAVLDLAGSVNNISTQLANTHFTERDMFTVGPMVKSLNYNEPGHMTDKGTLIGTALRYKANVHGSSGDFINTNFDYVGGKTKYDGRTWRGKPIQANGKYTIWNLQGTYGTLIKDKFGNLDLCPYGGIGYRNVVNKDEGQGAYRREITYLYIPIGGELSYSKIDNFDFRLLGEFDYFLLGRVTSNLSEVSSAMRDVTVNQSSGYGTKIAFQTSYKFAQNAAVSLTPFFQYWNVGKSEDAYAGKSYDPDTMSVQEVYVAEPANNTKELGATLLFSFLI